MCLDTLVPVLIIATFVIMLLVELIAPARPPCIQLFEQSAVGHFVRNVLQSAQRGGRSYGADGVRRKPPRPAATRTPTRAFCG